LLISGMQIEMLSLIDDSDCVYVCLEIHIIKY
jgi:hypothetical protein